MIFDVAAFRLTIAKPVLMSTVPLPRRMGPAATPVAYSTKMRADLVWAEGETPASLTTTPFCETLRTAVPYGAFPEFVVVTAYPD